MPEFHDRRTGIIHSLGNFFSPFLPQARDLIVPFNPNATHPLDSKPSGRAPSTPSPELKGYDVSTGFPIPEKDMKRYKKKGLGLEHL